MTLKKTKNISAQFGVVVTPAASPLSVPTFLHRPLEAKLLTSLTTRSLGKWWFAQAAPADEVAFHAKGKYLPLNKIYRLLKQCTVYNTAILSWKINISHFLSSFSKLLLPVSWISRKPQLQGLGWDDSKKGPQTHTLHRPTYHEWRGIEHLSERWLLKRIVSTHRIGRWWWGKGDVLLVR